jgi:hypothetical protein
MRTFAQKQVRPRQPLPSSLFRLSSSAAAPHEPRDLILRLQRTVGNRAMQRMLGSDTEAPRSKPAAGVNTRGMPDRRLVANDLAQLIERSGVPAGSLAKSPGTILRQKSGPVKKGDEPRPESKPVDREKLTKALCVNEPIDDAHALCQFTREQSSIVRIVKEHALRRCTRAISAINMPGNEDQVKKLARDYFSLNVKLSERTKKAFIRNIQAVADKLSQSPIECGNCQDKHCNGGAIAHVDEARTFLVLCPLFFNSDMTKLSQTPRVLIHEAGHLANLDQNASLREEFYCFMGATKDEKCPVVDAIHNVDTWSHFINELSFTI